ncbi:MAG: diacylglycerol/polyprenol kinase family protein, partial [Candidatus Thorarchaeota archaeon]
FAVIGFTELLRRWRNFSAAITRKVIHLFGGFAIFTVPFYSQAWLALFVSFPVLILIFLSSPKSPVKSLRAMFEVMAREEDYLSGHIWGPMLYAISINILVAIFTLIPTLVPLFIIPALGLTAMYLGDGIAPIIGAKIGKHRYTIGKSTRSLEGSLSVFIASFCGAWLSWLFLDFFASGGTPIFNVIQIGMLGIICASSATIIEGISPAGVDNITVPLLTALIVFLSALVVHPTILVMILIP